jgi:hypothetical protein
MRRLLVVVAGAALLFAVPALADRGHGHDGDRDRGERHAKTLLFSRVAPTVPTDPAVHGVAPGGAPWVIDEGSVRLRSDGRLHVEVEGLVIPTRGNTNPVSKLAASLFCAGDAPVASTDPVDFSPQGDAEIEATLDLPRKCLAAVVLLRVNDASGPYIAASGFGG